MMEFSTNHALNKTFRVFGYINHAWHLGFKDEMVLYAHDLDQLQIMWEAYKHFFEVKGEPTFLKEGTNQIGWPDYYRNTTKENLWSIFKQYRKRPREVTHPIVYSISDVKKSHYGINGLSKENIMKNLRGIDLGDTRNFESADQLIDKITKLSTAQMFFGSHCSWAFICPYFDTPWIQIQETELIQLTELNYL